MEKPKKPAKFFSWMTLWTIVIACVLNGGTWIAFHGVPLIGLPENEEVKSIVLIHSTLGEREVSDEKDISLLVNAANLLNYRFSGETEGEPIIKVIYHLKDGKDITIQANRTTMWWHGKSHPIKETKTFINIIEGLFFSTT